MDKVIRLCHINLEKGFRGGERQTFLLVKALVPYLDQTVVVRKNSGLAKALEEISDIRTIEINKPFLLNIRHLRRFDIVHAHEAKAGHLALAARLFFSIPYVITRRVAKKPKLWRLSQFVYRGATRVVAISGNIRSVITGLVPGIRCDVIPSSFSRLNVDENQISVLRPPYHKKFVVGHVGALVNKDKGQIHIINAALKLTKQFPDLHFIFVGEGVDREWFQTAAAGNPAIEFTGFKTNVGDYFFCFDLFLLPSLDEGLGSSILDAFYFGLPVIASTAGGIPDLVKERETGLVVAPGNEVQLENAILTLYKDRNLGKRMGEAGRASLMQFDINHTKDRYLDIYKASAK